MVEIRLIFRSARLIARKNGFDLTKVFCSDAYMIDEPINCYDPDSVIRKWLNANPESAINIAHATLFGRFVDRDGFGEQFLNPNNITDVNDLFNEIDPVVDSSSFADLLPTL